MGLTSQKSRTIPAKSDQNLRCSFANSGFAILTHQATSDTRIASYGFDEFSSFSCVDRCEALPRQAERLRRNLLRRKIVKRVSKIFVVHSCSVNEFKCISHVVSHWKGLTGLYIYCGLRAAQDSAEITGYSL